MEIPVLILTVGLPCSGKSTWAKSSGFPIVNPDSIRLVLHGQKFYDPAEPMVWAIARIMVEALFKAGHEIVVLDATNTTTKRRDDWLSTEWRIEYQIFHISMEECIRRAYLDGQDALVPIIERMAKNWEEPLGTF